MICAHYIRGTTSPDATWFDRLVEGTLSRLVRFYERTLHVVLRFPILTLLVFFATIALTVTLYVKIPKGYFPQDDSGLVIGSTRASPDVSFQAMLGCCSGRRHRGVRSRGGRRGIEPRRQRRAGRRLQPRPDVHQPEAARGA